MQYNQGMLGMNAPYGQQMINYMDEEEEEEQVSAILEEEIDENYQPTHMGIAINPNCRNQGICQFPRNGITR